MASGKDGNFGGTGRIREYERKRDGTAMCRPLRSEKGASGANTSRLFNIIAIILLMSHCLSTKLANHNVFLHMS